MQLIPIVSLIKWPLSSMEDVLKMLNLFNDNEIFRGYTTMIELCNALKFIPMLIFIQNILTFNLGVACLKSMIIVLFITDFSTYRG